MSVVEEKVSAILSGFVETYGMRDVSSQQIVTEVIRRSRRSIIQEEQQSFFSKNSIY